MYNKNKKICKEKINLKLSSLFSSPDNSIINSIRTYQKALMEDINLKLRVTYGQKTYTTHIADWQKTKLTFEAPMSGTEHIILPHHLAINVIFVSKVGLFHTKVTITKNYSKDDNLYYIADITAPLEKKQQRAFYRLDILLDVQYEQITYENDEIKILSSGQGTCVNISLGGMCLVCDEQLHAKDKLSLSFSLADQPLTFIGEVLYMGEKTEKNNYSHRIRFADLDAADVNLLNRLIFTVQREQIRRS